MGTPPTPPLSRAASRNSFGTGCLCRLWAGLVALLTGNCHVVRRVTAPSELGSLGRITVSFFLALGLAALLLEVQGKPGIKGILLVLEGGFGNISELTRNAHDDGLHAIPAFFKGTFYDNYALADSLLKSIPIFLCSLGVAVCFYLQVWNIGAEGQYVMGAVGSTAVVLAFPESSAWLLLPGMFIAAVLTGGFWAFLPAMLRERFRTNEIITTLMLNYIAILLLQYLVSGPWKDPGGQGFIMSMEFPAAAHIPAFIGRIHWGVVFCVFAAFVLRAFLHRTRYGYEILAGGANANAARYAGMRYRVMVVGVMALCGAFAGIAGCFESSSLGRLWPNIAVGYGYTAIVVAWLARLRITRIALFSILLAGLRVGGENLQLELEVSAAFGDMIQGLILLVVLAGQFFDGYSLRLGAGDGGAAKETIVSSSTSSVSPANEGASSL